MDTAILAT